MSTLLIDRLCEIVSSGEMSRATVWPMGSSSRRHSSLGSTLARPARSRDLARIGDVLESGLDGGLQLLGGADALLAGLLGPRDTPELGGNPLLVDPHLLQRSARRLPSVMRG